MKHLKGKLTISRPQCSSGEKIITISLIDEDSSCECVEIVVGLAEFAEALTGMGHVDCEFEWRPKRVGTKREYKSVAIKIGDDFPKRGEEAKLLKKYEKDGWTGRTSDVTNPHNWRTIDGVRHVQVHFERWVPAEAEEEK